MTAPAYRPENLGSSVIDWLANGGFSTAADAHLDSCRETRDVIFARRLVRYISSDSTIRVRTLEQYGKAPSVERIAQLRAEWKARCSQKLTALYHEPRVADQVETEADFVVAPAVELKESERKAEVAACLVPTITVAKPDIARPANDDTARALFTPREVIEQCAAMFGLTYDAVVSQTRKQKCVRARNLAAAVLRARGNSYPSIASRIKKDDHTTAIHAVKQFFFRDMRNPMVVQAWMQIAPCVFKSVRSLEELNAMLVVRI